MSKQRSKFGALVWLLCTAWVGAYGQAAEPESSTWPQWRGPSRDGRVAGGARTRAWPENLAKETLVETWRVPLGPSYSGPIVSSSAVFTTETRDKKLEVVRALDRKSGKQLWIAEWEGELSVPFFAKSNGDWIRATPAYDGASLYVAGMRDLLVCLDAKTGERRWHVDFIKEFDAPAPAFGFVSSPLVLGEHVYVQAGASLCKLESRTGKVLWRALKDDGGMYGSAFSSPVEAVLADRKQLVVQTRQRLAGVNPDSGEELWTQAIPAFRGMNILTPTILPDAVFTSSYGGKSFLIDVKKSSGKFTAAEKWSQKATGYMSSPVVIGGHMYLHLQNQRFTCLDLATGESKWTTTPYGKYWSMVVHGDRILALDERGELLLIRANPEKFELLDTRKVSEDSAWAHLAVCGDEVFVRELSALVAFRWRIPGDDKP